MTHVEPIDYRTAIDDLEPEPEPERSQFRIEDLERIARSPRDLIILRVLAGADGRPFAQIGEEDLGGIDRAAVSKAVVKRADELGAPSPKYQQRESCRRAAIEYHRRRRSAAHLAANGATSCDTLNMDAVNQAEETV